MQVVVKQFHELTVDELYAILRLRAQVFVVEQNCIYQDLDDVDQEAWHVYIKDNEEIVGCLRVIDKSKLENARYQLDDRHTRLDGRVRRENLQRRLYRPLFGCNRSLSRRLPTHRNRFKTVTCRPYRGRLSSGECFCSCQSARLHAIQRKRVYPRKKTVKQHTRYALKLFLYKKKRGSPSFSHYIFSTVYIRKNFAHMSVQPLIRSIPTRSPLISNPPVLAPWSPRG